MNKSFVLLIMTVFFTACATSQTAPTYTEAPTPIAKSDQAVLYIYRIYAQPTAWAAYLQLDGNEVTSLHQEGFTWVYVQAGSHKFKYGWPGLAGMPSVNFEHTLEAGQAYAFEMYGSAGNPNDYGGAVSQMKNVDIEIAKQKMATCCRYVAPKLKN
jgi:hypothetical protein